MGKAHEWNEENPTLKLRFGRTTAIERGLFLQFIGLHPNLRVADDGGALIVYRFDDGLEVQRTWAYCDPDEASDDDGIHYVARLQLNTELGHYGATFTANKEREDGSWGVVMQRLAFWQEVVETSDFVSLLQKIEAPGEVEYKTYGGHGKTRRAESSARATKLFDEKGKVFDLKWATWSFNVHCVCVFDFEDSAPVEEQGVYSIFKEEGE